MKRVMLGICLVSLLVVATGASAASAAEPAFFECAKLAGGKFKGGTCAEESAKGNHELVEGIGAKPLAVKSTLVDTLIPQFGPGAGKIECKKASAKGTLASPTRITKLVITQKECFSTISKFCTSAGQPKHTVATNSLEGTLGYIDAAEHRLGIDIKGEGGADIMDFNCEGLEEVIAGSAIGEVSPVGKSSSAFTAVFTRDAEGFQSISSFEGEPEDVPLGSLNGSGPYPASLSGTITFKPGKLFLKG
ncbi:MAG TPA: hypothetical protein VL988_11765 [Solirubrobacteraceae bacterium]|nr:hypothetical protein [Solirubrobacteraceae bacterium]